VIHTAAKLPCVLPVGRTCPPRLLAGYDGLASTRLKGAAVCTTRVN
jgi:hypothetical protein